MHSQRKPFWLENPKRRPGLPSLSNFSEMFTLHAFGLIDVATTVQCKSGARTAKPTDLLQGTVPAGTGDEPSNGHRCEELCQIEDKKGERDDFNAWLT